MCVMRPSKFHVWCDFVWLLRRHATCRHVCYHRGGCMCPICYMPHDSRVLLAVSAAPTRRPHYQVSHYCHVAMHAVAPTGHIVRACFMRAAWLFSGLSCFTTTYSRLLVRLWCGVGHGLHQHHHAVAMALQRQLNQAEGVQSFVGVGRPICLLSTGLALGMLREADCGRGDG